MTATVSLDPSGDPSGRSDLQNLLNAISAIPQDGATIIMTAGDWYLPAGQVVIALPAPVWIFGYGAIVHAVGGGSGDLIRMYNPVSNGSASSPVYGGGVLGLVLDGSKAGAGSTLDGATWVGRAVQNVS